MSFKQYDRESNARRVKDRQRQRMLDGYRPLFPPYGYKYVKDSNGKKVLDFADDTILIIKEALESFAKGRFVSREELRLYLNEQGLV
jgi:DNA invertase Pin-like site-specific DNA recombinase